MRVPRLYQPIDLAIGQLQVSEPASHYLCQVLRLKPGNPLIVFNGQGGEYRATLLATAKRREQAVVELQEFCGENKESPLRLCYAQAISRKDKMDIAIQKAVELGVTTIIPLISEYCDIKLRQELLTKKLQHWQHVVISACEQCGRNLLPQVMPIQPLSSWLLSLDDTQLRLFCDPRATETIPPHEQHPEQGVTVFIGPEGGLSTTECQQLHRAHFHSIGLGSRILRFETAAAAALTLVQYRWGDLSLGVGSALFPH